MRRLSVLVPILAIAATLADVPEWAKAGDEAAIRALEQRLIDGFKARDIKQMMSCYVPGDELFVFDVVTPRQFVGNAAYQKSWQGFMDMFQGPINVELSDLAVASDGRIAYSHSIQRYTGTGKDGKPIDLTLRYTDVYRKGHGKWLIVQEHISVPIDMATGKPDFTSKP